MPRASDELNASARSMAPWWASRRSFTGSLHIAPEEMIIMSELRSHFPGFSSSTARSGRENGSPTITRPLTFSRSTVSSISAGSYLRLSSRHTRPPSARVVFDVKAPVPCMSGQAGMSVTPTPGPASSAARTPSIPPLTS